MNQHLHCRGHDLDPWSRELRPSTLHGAVKKIHMSHSDSEASLHRNVMTYRKYIYIFGPHPQLLTVSKSLRIS